MKKKIKVAYLLDSSNSWIKEYLEKETLIKKNKKYSFKIFTDFRRVKNYEIVFILNYTKILKKNFLKKNLLNLVFHTSDLPKGKGFAPLQWQILEKKNKINISLFEAIEKFDSGRIFLKDHVILKGDELYNEIRYRQVKVIFKMINSFLKKYPNVSSKKQIGKSTFYKKRYPKDSKLNINTSIKKQFNKMRIANNEKWPNFFYYKNKKFIIKIFKSK
jgi:methionyl-tRNA formyltransferase